MISVVCKIVAAIVITMNVAHAEYNNCHIINNRDYKSLYEIRLKYSDFYKKGTSFLLNKIKVKHQHSTILSIGPGDGSLEKHILDSSPNIKSLDLIEPNKNYVKTLKTKFIKHNKVNILAEKYTASHLNKKYDLIIMNQVAHLFDQPINNIEKTLSSLNQGGQLLIVIHSDHGMDYFRKHFSAKYKNLQMKNFITGEQISYALKNKSIAHEMHILNSSIDLTPCIKNNIECEKIINFIFLYNFTKCKQNHVVKDIQKKFLELQNSKSRLMEPMLAISITQ